MAFIEAWLWVWFILALVGTFIVGLNAHKWLWKDRKSWVIVGSIITDVFWVLFVISLVISIVKHALKS